MVGMIQQLPVEIEHVTVRVALAQDGDEAEDKRLKSERRGVGADQTLSGDL